jgi:hypothetical protein
MFPSCSHQVSFPELKIRLQQRLEHYGIVVTCIKEEEFCLIPMGGVLPMFPQRTLGIGGTAGMVGGFTIRGGQATIRGGQVTNREWWVDSPLEGVKPPLEGVKPPTGNGGWIHH